MKRGSRGDCVELPAGVVEQRARRMHARLHVDQLVADHLVLDQVLAEGLALARPGERLVEAGLREADRGRRHAEPLGIEVAHDGAEAGVLLADQVGRRHAHIVEMQASRCRSTTSPSSSAACA